MQNESLNVESSATTLADAGPSQPRIESLVLDAGPLLTQSPLAGLAQTYYMTPSVLAELRDAAARKHLDFLQTSGQINLIIKDGGAAALRAVTSFARQTGDYPVLSAPDLSVLALAYALEVERHGTWRLREKIGGPTGQQAHEAARLAAAKASQPAAASTKAPPAPKPASDTVTPPAPASESLHDKLESLTLAPPEASSSSLVEADDQDGGEWITPRPLRSAIEDDDAESQARHDGGSDGEGEWITEANISAHKARSVGLITAADEPPSLTGAAPSASTATAVTSEATKPAGTPIVKTKKKKGTQTSRMTVATMTGDYAVQNVLLQMGLALVSVEGARIQKVKSWVLRCHACTKICKDMDKKFCPNCGNPTLLRTSVTASASGAEIVHLKANYVYRNRGTKYSLPLPKAGKSAGAKAAVPILRADQAEWTRGVAHEKGRREKEERKLLKAAEKGGDGWSARYEACEDLTMLLAGGTGKDRRDPGGLPALGVGRKNPNERRYYRA